MWRLLEDDKDLAVKHVVFNTVDAVLLEMEIVDALRQRQTLRRCRAREASGRVRTSTVPMFVNTNVHTQKHILSLCYHPRKCIWFPATIPADILQWFKEARFKKKKKKFFVRFCIFKNA